tara:strand:+ start:378 stop:716 length:339 start_codon:yes stop_codon:yes gene_type:complete
MYLENFKVRIKNVVKDVDELDDLLVIMYSDLISNQGSSNLITLRAKIRSKGFSHSPNKNLTWEDDTTAILEWSKQFEDEGYNLLTSSFSVDEIKEWMASDQVELILYELVKQ